MQGGNLGRKGLQRSVVVDNVVGSGAAGLTRRLRGNNFQNGFACEAVPRHDPLDLDLL